MSLEMYSEIILDHFKNPRNFGKLADANASARDVNLGCGDVIEISLRVEGSTVRDIRFEGQGCAISQATASMLTEFVKGKTADEILKMQPYDLFNLIGITLSPVRAKCAILSLNVLKLAVRIKGNELLL
jgi:nitrogen fixation NifU-like protein